MGDGSAVDAHEGAVASAAGIVDGVGKDLLAGAGLPCQQDGKIILRRLPRQCFDPAQFWGAANDLLKGIVVASQAVEFLLVEFELIAHIVEHVGQFQRLVDELDLADGPQNVAVFVGNDAAGDNDIGLLGLELARQRLPQDVALHCKIPVLHPGYKGGIFDHLRHRPADGVRALYIQLIAIGRVDVDNLPLRVHEKEPIGRDLKEALIQHQQFVPFLCGQTVQQIFNTN